MSLINEALKRARDASFEAGPMRTQTGAPYRVRDSEEAMFLHSRSGLWGTLLVIVMAGVAVAAFSLRMAKPGRHLREAMSFEADNHPLPQPPPAVSVERKPLPVPAPVVSPRPAPKTAPPAPAAVSQPQAEAPTPPPAPEPPKFSLQGITIAPDGNEAMINGYSVREGEEVDGARVVAIESRRVRLRLGDREIILRMP